MNNMTYTWLRKAAYDLRRSALQSGKSLDSMEDLGTAVRFLVSEMHAHDGGDITVGSPAQYAAVLRDVADAIERQ